MRNGIGSMVMSETRWYFGYKCEVIDGLSSWCYVVHVPRSHPVRVVGLGDAFVWLAHDGWIIVEGGFSGWWNALVASQSIAEKLRELQNSWDRLSPYEREYMIW